MKIIRRTHLFLSPFALSFLVICQLNAQDIFNSIEVKYQKYIASASKERVQIITDRDVYTPSERIWFNASIYKTQAPQISELSKEISIYLLDRTSEEVINMKFPLKNGHASGFITLPTNLQEGIFYLQGETPLSGKNSYYYKKVIIKNKILPQFLIKASFQKPDYIPGDDISITLDFLDFYNEPKRNVEYMINFYDGKKKIVGPAGKVKKTGQVVIPAKVPSKLKSGVFTYQVSAECKGMQASLSGIIPVLTDQLYIEFYPENGKLIGGIESRVSVYTYDAGGVPIAAEADLIVNDNSTLTFSTDDLGIGSFTFTPKEENTYHVQIKRPLLLDKAYILPPIESKGIALKEISKNSSMAKYRLINGYQSDRLVYLIGISDGKIFWKSEHEIGREMTVEIDLSKANGVWAHLMAFNAAERVEGEHIFLIQGMNVCPVEMNEIERSSTIKVKNQIEIKVPEEGRIIFSSVNYPWIIGDGFNQNSSSIGLPVDLHKQLIFQSNVFNKLKLNEVELDKYRNYYIPYEFGWDAILGTGGAFTHHTINDQVLENLLLFDEYIGTYAVSNIDGKATHVNLIPSQQFAAANPHYVQSLYKVRSKKKPAYKILLENGTPVLEVLQTIKPYNLQGSNIVFMGGATSLNFQGGALIAIDGVNRGTDAGMLSNLSPFDVETITASTNPNDILRYTGLNNVGIVEVTLKSGPGLKDEEKEIVDKSSEFTAPEYSGSSDKAVNDFRSTLWWEEATQNSSNNKVVVQYYTSELISNVKETVTFIPNNGIPSTREIEYEIK